MTWKGFTSKLIQPVRRNGKAILGLLTALTAIFAFWGSLKQIGQEWYGPDVRIGALSPFVSSGYLDLLTEFRLSKQQQAKEITGVSGEQIGGLFGSTPQKEIGKISDFFGKSFCQAKPGDGDLYLLPIFVQNLGRTSAKEYKVIISFTSKAVKRPDPGVRIRGYSGDGFNLAYFSGEKNLLDNICGKKKLTVLSARKDGNSFNYSPLTDDLAESVYDRYGLTRDLIIINGTLEAQLYQIAVLILDIPKDVQCFGAIYEVECENCKWLLKTGRYFELFSKGRKPCLGA